MSGGAFVIGLSQISSFFAILRIYNLLIYQQSMKVAQDLALY